MRYNISSESFNIILKIGFIISNTLTKHRAIWTVRAVFLVPLVHSKKCSDRTGRAFFPECPVLSFLVVVSVFYVIMSTQKSAPVTVFASDSMTV